MHKARHLPMNCGSSRPCGITICASRAFLKAPNGSVRMPRSEPEGILWINLAIKLITPTG